MATGYCSCYKVAIRGVSGMQAIAVFCLSDNLNYLCIYLLHISWFSLVL
jgi:hypothetical protein